MQGVAASQALTPYIKTLTFGSADVAKAGEFGLRTMLNRVKGDKSMYQSVSDIYHALTGYRHLTERAIKNDLRNVLEEFPKFERLRFDVHDKPDHLGGWLTTEQRQYIDDKFKPGTSFWHLTQGTFQFQSQDLYDCSDWEAACSVLKVLSGIEVQIQELRISECGGSRPETLCCLLPKTLHTLHLTVNWDYNGSRCGEGGRKGDFAKVFFRALQNMPNLQYLALGKHSGIVGIRWTVQLFKALHAASKLHRIDLKGSWMLSSSLLIDFVKQHMDTLLCLVLNGCCMEGHWLPTLHSLADVFRDRLEYFSLLNPYYTDGSHWARQIEDFKTCPRSQGPDFTCTTDFGPGFRLLPGSDEV